MPNRLTGDYEAVMQVAVRQINGLLATLHQNGRAGSGLSPNFPHSVRNLRVGDRPRYLEVEVSQFAHWLGGTVQSFNSGGGPAISGIEIAAKAPPGAARRLHTALEEIHAAWTEPVTSGAVRGRAEVQVSTPRITLAPGSTSAVIVHVEVRARFIPDPGFSGLPSPIHGELQITYEVRPVKLPDGKRVLNVQVPAQDELIVYNDLGGLSATGVATITTRIRAAVRIGNSGSPPAAAVAGRVGIRAAV